MTTLFAQPLFPQARVSDDPLFPEARQSIDPVDTIDLAARQLAVQVEQKESEVAEQPIPPKQLETMLNQPDDGGGLLSRFGKTFIKDIAAASPLADLEELITLGPIALTPDVLRQTPTSELAKTAFGLKHDLSQRLGLPPPEADLVKASRQFEELRRTRIKALGLETTEAETFGEKAVDVAAGLSAFLIRYGILKKIASKSGLNPTLSSIFAFEVETQLSGGFTGEGVVMGTGLAAIQALPINPVFKVLLLSGAFGGLAAAGGGDKVDVAINMAIPFSFVGIGAVKSQFRRRFQRAKNIEQQSQVLGDAHKVAEGLEIARKAIKTGKNPRTGETLTREQKSRLKKFMGKWKIVPIEPVEPSGKPDIKITVNGQTRQVTQEQAERITAIDGTPSRNDMKGIVKPSDNINAQQRAEIKESVKAQMVASEEQAPQVDQGLSQAARQTKAPLIEAKTSEVSPEARQTAAREQDVSVSRPSQPTIPDIQPPTRKPETSKPEIVEEVVDPSAVIRPEGEIVQKPTTKEPTDAKPRTKIEPTQTAETQAQAKEDAKRQEEISRRSEATDKLETEAPLVNADPSKPSIRRGIISFGPLEQTGKFLKRNFTSKGDLPQKAFDAKIENDGRIGAEMRQIVFTLRDFRTASKKAYDNKITPEEFVQLNKALGGSKAKIPKEMVPVISKMRSEVDVLTRRMIDLGVVEGDLVAVLEANTGFYLKRAYRVFTDPKWAEKVPQDVRNKAKALFRQEFPNKNENEIEGLIQNFLYESKAAESPIAALKQSKLGSKDLSILKRRKAIAPEIRALWGEFKDPRINYANSVANMANLIANHQFLTRVKVDGLGKFLFEEPVSNKDGNFITRIAVDSSSAMEPLNGLYTTPEIKRAFEDIYNKQELGVLFKNYMKVNGLVKYSKTVLSLQTHIRNLIGNTGFAIYNGHYRIGKAGSAFKTIMSDIGVKNNVEYREYIKELRRLGVIHESARAGELQDIIKDAGEQDFDQYSDNWINKIRRGTIGVATTLYRAEDDVWKVFAFENEIARYSKARPDWTEQQVKEQAAEIVRNTYPTYSLVSRGVKGIRRTPLIGPFVSFTAEVVRTGKNGIGLAAKEIKDPRTRNIGYQRLIGILAAASGTALIATTSRFLSGVTDDEEDDMRRFLPPWSRNSQLVHIGKSPDGWPMFVDLSYTDPYEYLRKPVIALMNGEDFNESLLEAARETLEPFLGPEILAEALIEIAANKKSGGGRVFNPQDDGAIILRDMATHLGKVVEPGTITSARKVVRGLDKSVDLYGRDYDPVTEALAVFLGHRVVTLNIPTAINFRAKDYNRGKIDAQAILRKAATKRGDVTKASLEKAYLSMEKKRRKLFDTIHEDTQAAQRLGMTRDSAILTLKGAGIGITESVRIIDNVYLPYIPTSRFLQSIAISASAKSEEFNSLITTELNRRRGLIVDITQEN